MATRKNPALCNQAPIGQDCCCCKRCNVGGCDLQVLPCMCCLHARCCPISETQILTHCPICSRPSSGLLLLPLTFDDLDQAMMEATKTNLSSKRGKKRQNATVARLNPTILKSTTTTSDIILAGDDATGAGESSELRTGRWTPEETEYCDKLIEHFSNGNLPIPGRIKLNDFLANMLKSKQSRLTKKMKNARFSSKQYERTVGFILSLDEAREFSQLETNFFASMKCNMERSEIRFHMQKVWRELFSAFCISIGQKMDVDAWLKSVEEADRRRAEAKDAARKARRQLMMGVALRTDASHVPTGVFIDPDAATDTMPPLLFDRNGNCVQEPGSEVDCNNSISKRQKTTLQSNELVAGFHSSPYVARVMQHIQRRGLPFEHVDIWVPSFVNNLMDLSTTQQTDACRLCFAGTATADTKIPPDGLQPIAMTSQEKFNLISFGVYSQRFSFVVGSGLPGRIYSSGLASWEQGIQSAPQSLFERVGGAQQWGIQTVLGIPVASPNVGRVVVLLYSIHDRPQDSNMVTRVAEELTALIPSPRWKLVVEIGEGLAPQLDTDDEISMNDSRSLELLVLLDENMPKDQHAPLACFLPGMTSLRLLLMKPLRTAEENESLEVALSTYEACKFEGRSTNDIIGAVARTIMVMSHPTDSSSETGGVHSSKPTDQGNVDTMQPAHVQQHRAFASHSETPFSLESLSTGTMMSPILGMNDHFMVPRQQTNSHPSPHISRQAPGPGLAPSHSNRMEDYTTNLPQGQNDAQGAMSSQQLQQLAMGSWNDVLPEFGNLDASLMSNLANSGITATQLAALLQSESASFL